MFLELYWQYFAVGVFSYIVARFGYIALKYYQKSTFNQNKLSEKDLTTAAEGKFDLYNSSEMKLFLLPC